MGIKGIDYNKCKDCGLCYEVCPTDVFGKFANKVYVKYPEDCQCCNLCNVACPVDACLVDDLRPIPLPGRNKPLEAGEKR